MNSKHMRHASRHAILAVALLALAACGGKPDGAPAAGETPAAAPAADAQAPAAPATTTPAAPAAESPAPGAALQLADIDAYVRGMTKEDALLRDEFAKIERARAADDAEAETSALFAMTSSDVDQAGAAAAGLAPARYQAVKDRIDEVQSKLDMLEGFRKLPGDSSALQAQLGDPYAAFAPDVAAALEARRAELAALRAEAMGLRLKAAGG